MQVGCKLAASMRKSQHCSIDDIAENIEVLAMLGKREGSPAFVRGFQPQVL
jgi:hypothetical protein